MSTEPGIERVFSDVWSSTIDHEIDVHVSASVGTGDPDGPGGHWVGVPQVTVEIGGHAGHCADLGWVFPDDAIELGQMLVAAGDAAGGTAITNAHMEACGRALRESRNVPGVGDPSPWEHAGAATRATYRREAEAVLKAYVAALTARQEQGNG